MDHKILRLPEMGIVTKNRFNESKVCRVCEGGFDWACLVELPWFLEQEISSNPNGMKL